MNRATNQTRKTVGGGAKDPSRKGEDADPLLLELYDDADHHREVPFHFLYPYIAHNFHWHTPQQLRWW